MEEDKPVQKWDWKDVTGCLVVDTGMEQRSRQASIKEWTQQEKDEKRNVPVGRKEKMKKPPPPPPLRRIEQERAGGEEA